MAASSAAQWRYSVAMIPLRTEQSSHTPIADGDSPTGGAPPPTLSASTAAPRTIPLFLAGFLCGFAPTRIARRVAPCSLLQAWLHHVSCLILTTLAIHGAAAWSLFRDRQLSLLDAWKAVFSESVNFLTWNPYIAWWSVFLVFLGVELVFVLLAKFMTPWGAADEPPRYSFQHALRVTWLHTGHVFLCAAIVGIVIGEVAAGNSINHEISSPIIFLVILFTLANAGWLFINLLLAVSARIRPLSACRPPMCETCGYDLTLADEESRCSECGIPIHESLGPGNHPGSHASMAGGRLLIHAILRDAKQALLHGPIFAQRLRLAPQDFSHRRCFLLHLPIIFLIGAASILIVIVGIEDDVFPLRLDHVLPPLFVGFFASISAAAFASACAGTVSRWIWRREKRNLMSGAVQVASYQMTLLALWSLWGGLTAALAIIAANENWLSDWARQYTLDHEFLIFVLWTLPNIGWVVIYIRAIYRGTYAMRYFNK